MFKSYFGSSSTIPILRLSGVIGQTGILRSGLTFQALDKLIDKLFSDKKSPAVVLIVNSPGGSPTQSSLIADSIILKAKKNNKKVIAFVEDVAASGGYWLACSADEIYIDNNSIVGSIGVISPGFGFVNLLKKIGIERRIYTSGKSKSFLDPFKQENPKDLKRLKNIQEQIHDNFINYVKTRRGKKLKINKEKDIFSGLFWVGQKAVDLGLVDGIGHLNQILKNKFGEKIKTKFIEPKKSFIQRKLASSLSPSLINSEQLIEYFEEKAYWSRYGL
jgi:signal peptide peptidase SppA